MSEPAEEFVARSAPPTLSQEAKILGLACHLSPCVVGFIGPLALWLAKKDDPFVAQHGKEALNFQLTLLILFVLGMVFGIFTFGLGMFVAFPILMAAAVTGLIWQIMGAVKASDGLPYRYPISLRFVR